MQELALTSSLVGPVLQFKIQVELSGVPIAVNVFRLQIVCRRQSCVVGNPVHDAEVGASQTRLFCRVWRGGVNWL